MNLVCRLPVCLFFYVCCSLLLPTVSYSEEKIVDNNDFIYRGIKFGTHVRDIPLCGKNNSNEACKESDSKISVNLKLLDIGVSEDLSIGILNNERLYLIHTYSSKNESSDIFYNKMKNLIEKKYGKPKVDDLDNFQNESGAKLPRHVTVWDLDNVTIILTDRITATTGLCQIEDKRYRPVKTDKSDSEALNNL